VVTGGSAGLGLAIATALTQAGSDVVLASRSAERRPAQPALALARPEWPANSPSSVPQPMVRARTQCLCSLPGRESYRPFTARRPHAGWSLASCSYPPVLHTSSKFACTPNSMRATASRGGFSSQHNYAGWLTAHRIKSGLAGPSAKAQTLPTPANLAASSGGASRLIPRIHAGVPSAPGPEKSTQWITLPSQHT